MNKSVLIKRDPKLGDNSISFPFPSPPFHFASFQFQLRFSEFYSIPLLLFFFLLMADLEQILLSRLPCAPIIYDLIIKMKTRRAASRRVSRWAPCGTKNSIEKSMLIYENYELSLPDSQPKSGRPSRGGRGVQGGRRGGEWKGWLTPFAPSLGNSLALFVAFCFSFYFLS